MSSDEMIDQVEKLEMVQYRMQAEGFHYCFKQYSSFDEVKDEEFHQLRRAYLEAASRLESYVTEKIEDLRSKIEE
jgi:hypothetical protein